MRFSLVPFRRLFVGVGDAENKLFMKWAARDLHADGRARFGEATRNTHGRKSRDIKRNRAETVGAAALVLAANFLAIDIQPTGVAFIDGGNGKGYRWKRKKLHAFKQIMKFVANDAPYSLRHQISRCRDEQRRKISVQSLFAVVARASSEIALIGRSILDAASADFHRRHEIHMRN